MNAHQPASVIRRLLLICLPLMLCSCASTQITPKPGQTLFYHNGDGIVLSEKKQSTVAVRAAGTDSDGRVQLEVVVSNKSRAPFNVGLEHISATSDAGHPLRIYSLADLEKQARTRAAMAAFAVGINAGAQSFAASQPTTTYTSGGYYGTSQYNVSNPQGRPLGTVTGSQLGSVYGNSTTFDPARTVMAQQAIQANAMSSAGAIQSGLAQSLQAAREIFALSTVFPGRSYAGLVVIKKAREIHLRVAAGSEIHSAAFTVK
jgi:hypothetical protein